jgi:hypothetical protein
MREAGTQGDRISGQQEGSVQGKEVSWQVSPPGVPSSLRGGKIKSTEVSDSALTRKAAIESEGTRTANRHR